MRPASVQWEEKDAVSILSRISGTARLVISDDDEFAELWSTAAGERAARQPTRTSRRARSAGRATRHSPAGSTESTTKRSARRRTRFRPNGSPPNRRRSCAGSRRSSVRPASSRSRASAARVDLDAGPRAALGRRRRGRRAGDRPGGGSVLRCPAHLHAGRPQQVAGQTARFVPSQPAAGPSVVPASASSVSDETLYFGDPTRTTERLSMLQVDRRHHAACAGSGTAAVARWPRRPTPSP